MTLVEFLKHFKTFKEVVEENPNNFPKKLYDGFWFRDDEKCRLELVNGNIENWSGARPSKTFTAAWIDYSALRDDPEKAFEMFLTHRGYRR